MRMRAKHKAITSTALISMTDVVFLLLIFFILTSTYVTVTGIDIPTTQNAHSEMRSNITLSIDANERISVNQAPVTQDRLEATLRGHFEQNPDMTVVIQSHRDISIGRVVELIDISKSAGFTKYYLAAQMAGR